MTARSSARTSPRSATASSSRNPRANEVSIAASSGGRSRAVTMSPDSLAQNDDQRMSGIRATIAKLGRPARRSLRGGDLALAPGDERVERLAAARIHRRWRGLRKELLPDAVRPLRGRVGAVLLPRLEVPPVRDQRPIEGCLVALEGVGRGEEVAAR